VLLQEGLTVLQVLRVLRQVLQLQVLQLQVLPLLPTLLRYLLLQAMVPELQVLLLQLPSKQQRC
jgi:hypothetical protein